MFVLRENSSRISLYFALYVMLIHFGTYFDVVMNTICFQAVVCCLVQCRTVARKSSIGGFPFVRGDFTFEQGGGDIKIWQKFHWFIVFQIISIWEAKPTKAPPPVATGLAQCKLQRFFHRGSSCDVKSNLPLKCKLPSCFPEYYMLTSILLCLFPSCIFFRILRIAI